VAALLLAVQAQAGIDALPVQGADVVEAQAPKLIGQASPATVGGASTTAGPARADKSRNVLRCWQEGKLILETGGVVPTARSGAAFQMRRVERGETTLQVLDLKQGLCILETSEAR
jgi:hypothetical protein